jgi:hypothetical protein
MCSKPRRNIKVISAQAIQSTQATRTLFGPQRRCEDCQAPRGLINILLVYCDVLNAFTQYIIDLYLRHLILKKEWSSGRIFI